MDLIILLVSAVLGLFFLLGGIVLSTKRNSNVWWSIGSFLALVTVIVGAKWWDKCYKDDYYAEVLELTENGYTIYVNGI